VSDVASRDVTTIEGLHPTGDHPVQKAWRQMNVPQCGLLPNRPNHAGGVAADAKPKTIARPDT
jgi:isoquinoline 1-oxidoreductase alpha subunit